MKENKGYAVHVIHFLVVTALYFTGTDNCTTTHSIITLIIAPTPSHQRLIACLRCDITVAALDAAALAPMFPRSA